MNLPTFLQQVDELCGKMSPAQYASAFHEMARVLPESERQNFLTILMNSIDPPEERTEKHSENLEKEISGSLETLEQINDGKKLLHGELNEEYDEWYSSDDEEFLLYDPQGLLKDIENAVRLVHTCVDQMEYEHGYRLADALSTVVVSAGGEYVGCMDDPFTISDLYSKDLLDGDEGDLVRESLFVTYMANPLSERATEILRILENYRYFHVTMEQVMQMGNSDLPDFDEFLPLWIEELGKKEDYFSGKYLEEAQSLLFDTHQQLEMAEKYTETHPELYLQYLQSEKDTLDASVAAEMNRTGLKAMDQIPADYKIRGEVALLTAAYDRKMNNPNPGSLEFCWREAFHSDSSSMNFLRVRLYDPHWEKFSADIRQEYEELYRKASESKSGYYGYGELTKNALSTKEYCWILFWDQRFDKVMQTDMRIKAGLGWSYTFMKEGLAGFLLLLYKKSENSLCGRKRLPKGVHIMLQNIKSSIGFSRDEFEKGLGRLDTDIKKDADEELEYFRNLFEKWKGTVNCSDAWECDLIRQIRKWISCRVDGIVGGQKRNYYGECAEYIAAFGEVLESRGQHGAKKDLMMKYRQEYPRHRAFHQELKRFE